MLVGLLFFFLFNFCTTRLLEKPLQVQSLTDKSFLNKVPEIYVDPVHSTSGAWTWASGSSFGDLDFFRFEGGFTRFAMADM